MWDSIDIHPLVASGAGLTVFWWDLSHQAFCLGALFNLKKIGGQGHGWGQRSRSHSLSSIQLMHSHYLGPRLWKVIQYIFPELCFLYLKSQRFSSNSFDMRSKIHCGSDGLFVEQLYKDNNKDYTIDALCDLNQLVTIGFTSQMAYNVKKSTSWYHHKSTISFYMSPNHSASVCLHIHLLL